MYSVRQIIKENWKHYLKINNPLKYQKKEIEKLLTCSKNSCNSRICSSCGKRYTDDWANNLKNILSESRYKHIVLTVPSFLREILRNWQKLSILMKSSRDFLKKLILM